MVTGIPLRLFMHLLCINEHLILIIVKGLVLFGLLFLYVMPAWLLGWWWHAYITQQPWYGLCEGLSIWHGSIGNFRVKSCFSKLFTFSPQTNPFSNNGFSWMIILEVFLSCESILLLGRNSPKFWPGIIWRRGGKSWFRCASILKGNLESIENFCVACFDIFGVSM